MNAKRWREEVRGGSNYLRLPDGVKPFLAKAGRHRLDFMSFVAGEGNPRAEPGEVYFERTFWVHRDVGPNREWHLCPAKTKKKPCPICEHRTKLSSDPDADEEVIKAMSPKERQLWLVKDLLNEPDSLMIWEVSYHLFGRMLKDKINNADEEDGYDFFAHPTEGLTMRLALQQSDRGKWVEAADIEFRPRKEQYDSDVVEEMPCLDDLLVATPYDKLKALFLQTEESEELDDEPEPEKPKRELPRERDEDVEMEERPRRKPKRAEFSSGDEVWYKDMRCEVLKVSGDGTSLMLEGADGEIYKAVGADDLQDGPVERQPSGKKPKQGGDEDDDWDVDEPEEKAEKKTAGKKPKQGGDEEDDWDEDWD